MKQTQTPAPMAPPRAERCKTGAYFPWHLLMAPHIADELGAGGPLDAPDYLPCGSVREAWAGRGRLCIVVRPS